MGANHALVGAMDSQVRTGTDRGSGHQATGGQQRAPRRPAAARCLGVHGAWVVVRSKNVRRVVGGDLIGLRGVGVGGGRGGGGRGNGRRHGVSCEKGWN